MSDVFHILTVDPIGQYGVLTVNGVDSPTEAINRAAMAGVKGLWVTTDHSVAASQARQLNQESGIPQTWCPTCGK